MSRIKSVIPFTASLTVAIAQVCSGWTGAAAAANATPAASPGYEACQTTDEAEFRNAVERVTTEALKKGLAGVDYTAAVSDEWRRLDVGRVIDKQVDAAVASVRDETSWGALLQSLGSEDKARELVTAVAERVYRSDAMKVTIEDLATGVGRSLGGRIELATSEAAGPAITCLQAFIGPRYGSTVAGLVAGTVSNDFAIGPEAAGADVTAGGVLSQSSDGITGAAILIMRRQLANMAGRIGQRLVGSILSRLVSVVAGGIGIALIAKDVWELRHGVLPIIATEMKSAESKASVQDELAKTLAEQIGSHMDEIGKQAANRIVAIWRDYRAAHTLVLDLAEREPNFRSFLDKVDAKAMPRVDETTALIVASEGEAGVLRRLADGTLSESVNRLPEAAMDIARQTRSLDTALAWNAVAGTAIDKVVELEIFNRAKPQDFTTDSLSRIVALGDPLAVKRMAAVPAATRDVLFELDPGTLTTAARALEERELTALAGYMTGLGPVPRQRLLQLVGQSPQSLKSLTVPRVRDAVLASKNQSAALEMLLRPPGTESTETLQSDVRYVLNGEVHPLLLWERHPILVVLAGLMLVVVLLLLRRLFRRPPAQGSPPDVSGSDAPKINA